MLGLTFTLLDLIFLCVLACLSGAPGGRISSNPAYATALRWLTGCVFIGLGFRLALQTRH